MSFGCLFSTPSTQLINSNRRSRCAACVVWLSVLDTIHPTHQLKTADQGATSFGCLISTPSTPLINSKPQIEEIHRRFPGTWDRIYLSGFSLGGNVIVKFLGEQVSDA